MATSVTNHIIVVKEEGLEKVLADIRSVDASLKSTTRSSRKANDAMHDMYNTQAKGVIGTGSAGQNFAKLSRTINGGGNSLVGAYATLAANIFSITAAFQALKDAAQFQQIAAGLELMGNRLGITLSTASQKVRELSGGLLSTEQAMRSTAQVISAGFGTAELERITKVAKDASFALGRDMSESMDRLTRGVIKLEPELIDELGIMTRLDEANKAYAKAMGKTVTQLTITERRQAFLNAALAEGQLKFGGLAEAGGDLTGLQQLNASFQDLTKSVLSFVNLAAIPLAKIISTSPGALLGLLVLFASTISKELLPGLAALEKQTLAVAEAKQKALTAEIANFNYSGKGNKQIIALQDSMKAGTATTRDYQIAVANLTSEIEQLSSPKAQARGPGGQFLNYGAKEGIVKEKQLIIAGLQDILTKEHEVAVASATSQAVVAASSGSLKQAYNQLSIAINLNNTAAKANGATFRTLNGTMLVFSTTLKNVAIAAKVAGAAFLNLIPIIGTIILVASILVDGIKAIYTAFVGKEVIEARKNLKEITEQIAEKTKEYNRIRAEAGSLATKEVMASKLLSNSLQEQVVALERLEQAERKRRQKSESSKSPLTEEQNKINTAINEASANSIFGLSDPAEMLVEQLKEGTPEVKAEIKKLTDNFGTLKEALKSPELSGSIIRQLAERFKEAGPALEAATTNFKGLEDAYTAFIKTATPTTPYDNLVIELNKTSDVLIDNTQLMSKGKLTAEQFANTINALGSVTLGNTSNEVRQLVTEIKKLEAAQLALKTLEDAGKKNTSEYRAALKDQEAAQTNIKNLSGKAAALLVQDVIKQKEKATQIQSQSILMAGQLAMAQAQLATVSSYNDLSGKGTEDRLKAENNVKSIQAQQILLQVEMLKVSIQALEIEKRKSKIEEDLILTRLKNLKIISDELDLKQSLSKLQDPNLTPEARAELNNYIDKKQESLNLENQIRNATAGIASAQMQAAAATANMNSAAYIAAAKAATIAKTQDQIAKNTLSLAEQQSQLDADRVELGRIQLGIAKDILNEYDDLYNKQSATQSKALEAIEKESNAKIAALREQQANAISKGGGKENERLYDILIQQETTRAQIAKDALITSDAKARLEVLGVKTALDLEQEKLDILNQQLTLVQAIEEASASARANQREIAKITRELAGGPVSKLQTLRDERDKIQEEYDAAKRVADIKLAIIEAEYALLAAQLTQQKNILVGINERRQKEGLEAQSLDAIQGLDNAINQIPNVVKASQEALRSGLEKSAKQLEKANTATTLSGGRIDLNKTYDPTKSMSDSLAIINANPLENFQAALLDANEYVNTFVDKLKELGPEGEAISAFAQGSLVIADAMLNITRGFESIKGATGKDLLKGISNIATSAEQGIAAINSIYQASAKAKIASIDQEIAAEQKRDGKSAESVAKLAALEKKKDGMARKAFEMNKKLMIAQAVMSTAAGVTMALASVPPPFSYILAGITAAMGAAQLAIISGMQYQSTANAAQVATPSTVSIGKRGSSVDLARNNMSVGGELGYLTGATGYGSNPSNFTRRAYGGPARAGMVVGEKGPELFVPSVPGNVVSNDNMPSTPSVNANITIQAIDAEGVEQVLTNNRGHIIGMLREAANSSGQSFLEGVNTQKYRRGGARL